MASAVEKLLQDGLTSDEAVQIALLNNRGLQATYEELGIAQADLVQAGLLKNPMFEDAIRFVHNDGRAYDLGATQDSLGVLLIPMRKKAEIRADGRWARPRRCRSPSSAARRTGKARGSARRSVFRVFGTGGDRHAAIWTGSGVGSGSGGGVAGGRVSPAPLAPSLVKAAQKN